MTKGALGLALVLAAGVIVVAPVSAQQTPYEVTLTGTDDGTLRELLQGTATLFRLSEQPPPSPIGLRRRADADQERLQTALRSVGYYDAKVEIAVDTDVTPAKVAITVTPGPEYKFDRIAVAGAGGVALEGAPITAGDIGIQVGERASSATVVDAETRITNQLSNRGFAFARIADRRVVVDHEARTMDVTYTVDPGPLTRFGAVSVEGLEGVSEQLVRNRIPWRPGDQFKPSDTEDARQAISALGPFSSVRVGLAKEPGPDGVTPVTVTVAERPRRVIGAGFNYSSEDGFGVSASWAHRNLFGGAEQLRLSATLSRIGENDVGDVEARLNANFRKPDFLSVNQSLILDASLVRERPDAYDRDAVVFSALLERKPLEGLTVTGGITLEQSSVTDPPAGTVDSTLVGIPLKLTYDGTNDLLNPTRGFRTDLLVTPYQQIGGADSNFTIARVTNSAYFDFAGDGRYVAAGRFSLGSIIGSSTTDIPADKRFYAGGGGSIRGYGYQDVGPRDALGETLGGRSLVEVGAEMRVKVTDTIGIVPFIDGGNVYEDSTPDFSEELRWGAGIGARYYTGFGPLRVDVAVPLNKQPGDSSWQLYISIGQAF
ncbi:membrane protein [Skermanella stibiiresistens SB22]|uniref:Membrane protein n=1 Tax=Skermanella stibiiresistens SB22 TaxID=1385369 RepID=W9GWV9_9PROT|nr:autotransporter assembly complex family protein [Skermanella stibiiresistens]EWY38395.1 membrane protein [Skermanella stibiiresistens SB22]